MKKIILVILLLLCMGCSSTNKSAQVENTNIYAIKFEYEGHSYIQFNAGRNANGVSGYVHDPNCWCMIDYD